MPIVECAAAPHWSQWRPGHWALCRQWRPRKARPCLGGNLRLVWERRADLNMGLMVHFKGMVHLVGTWRDAAREKSQLRSPAPRITGGRAECCPKGFTPEMSHLILTRSLWRRNCHWPRFAEEKADTEKVSHIPEALSSVEGA